MKNFAKPVIERFYEDNLIDERRRNTADAICRYLNGNGSCAARREYYEAVTTLLESRNSERILLYLPFEELRGHVPIAFQNAYRMAWYHLITVQDARENFHEGDTFELDARPNGHVERVVKAAHLIPWLLRYHYLSGQEILRIINLYSDNVVLLQSINDTLPYIQDHNLLSTATFDAITSALRHIPPRQRLQPLYVSQKRIDWLNEKAQTTMPALVTPNAHLEGPFSPNIATFQRTVDNIEANLAPDDIVLIGGSQLKGYGTVDSDVDIWNLKDILFHEDFRPGNPNSIHIYFNTLWLGGSKVDNLQKIINKIVSEYMNLPDERQHLERLESDLLQYRLLHKGFARFTGISQYSTAEYTDIDGDCPFYNRTYRAIATMLYAKYVYIPSVTPA